MQSEFVVLLRRIHTYHSHLYPVLKCLHIMVSKIPKHPLGKQVITFCVHIHIQSYRTWIMLFKQRQQPDKSLFLLNNQSMPTYFSNHTDDIFQKLWVLKGTYMFIFNKAFMITSLILFVTRFIHNIPLKEKMRIYKS